MNHAGQSLRKWMRRIRRDQRGVAATEYAVLLGLVIVVVAVAVNMLGGHVDKTTSAISHNLATESGMHFVSYADTSSAN